MPANANPGITIGPNTYSVIGDTLGNLAEVHDGQPDPLTPGLVTRSLVYFGDSMSLDAFGRLRVSEAITFFDGQQEYGLDTLRVWDATANGTLSNASRSTDGSVSSGGNAVGPTNATTRLTPITVAGTGAVKGTATGAGDARNPFTLSQIDALTAYQDNISLVVTSLGGNASVTSAMNWHEQTV